MKTVFLPYRFPDAKAILEQVSTVDVVGIDEAQFFDEALPEVCDTLAIQGTRVIVAGLDMDYLRKAIRTNAGTSLEGGIHHQVACHLHAMRKYCELFLQKNRKCRTIIDRQQGSL